MSCLFLAFGGVFLYISRNDASFFPKALLFIFVAVGVFLFFLVLILYKKVKSQGGTVLFEANSEGLSLYPNGNAGFKSNFYDWDFVDAVFLVKDYHCNTKFYYSDREGILEDIPGLLGPIKRRIGIEWQKSKHVIVSVFKQDTPYRDKDWLRKYREYICLTPKGQCCTYSFFNSLDPNIIIKNLREICPDTVKVSLWNEVTFDYVNQKEEYLPL